MTELGDLYQELILDHARSPRRFGEIEGATHQARGDNPLCGDSLEISLRIEGGKIESAGFTGTGCAISTASASLLLESIVGGTIEDAEKLLSELHAALTSDVLPKREFGKLIALLGVKEFPMRVKCATLSLHTVRSAIRKDIKTVTTEK